MKQKLLLSIASLIFVAILCACTNTKSEENALKSAEKYNETAGGNQYDYQNDLFDWLKPEEKYFYADDADRVDNISGTTYDQFVQGNRLYFSISKDHASSIWAYIGLATGEKLYLCPDPLCPHTNHSECKYLDMGALVFLPDSNSSFYTVKRVVPSDYIGIYDAIFFIDTENDTMTELYKPDYKDLGLNEGYDIRPYFLDGKKLYFSLTKRYNVKTDNGEIERKSQSTMMILDTETKVAKKLTDIDKYSSDNCIMPTDNYIFFEDYNNHRLYVTDMNFENEQTVMDFDSEFSVTSVFYDNKTQELFFSVCSNYMRNFSAGREIEIEEGYIYCVDSNLKCRKIDMPSDKIINFSLTDNFIYYTSYDPVSYGMSPRGGPCIDETGNKIYRVNRSDTSEGELIFDGRGELLFCGNSGYCAVGDYIYIDYCSLVKEAGMAYFRNSGSTARVNIKENTIKWLNLE